MINNKLDIIGIKITNRTNKYGNRFTQNRNGDN
jgi:hypothetical protein